MDIEEFYDGDPRRRRGKDHQFGAGWSDDAVPESLYELYWNDGTGELYLMCKPVVDPLVGWVGYALKDDIRELGWIEHRIVGVAEHLIHPRQIKAKTGAESDHHPKEALTEDLTVEVLQVVPDATGVQALLTGWEAAMGRPGSLGWLRARLSGATGRA